MEQRERFVILAQSDRYTKTELCEQFGISRKTGHKWLRRYVEEGKKGLDERSRAPKSVANRTDESVERLIAKRGRAEKCIIRIKLIKGQALCREKEFD